MNLNSLWYHIQNDEEFQSSALSLFRFQYLHNKVYQQYCNLLNIAPETVFEIEKIPFLPISFFKTHRVITTEFHPEKIFLSSSTTGQQPSRHEIKELSLYEKSFLHTFSLFYGDPSQYVFLALLPGYLERENSSLVYMMNELVLRSGKKESGFYLRNYKELSLVLSKLKSQGQKTILFGVTFALLDLAEQYPVNFPELIIFETGGMKGQRQELVKEEVHSVLKKAFHTPTIHSEYGMCELLSQAYSYGDNLFQTPPWMQLLLRDEKDPLHVSKDLKSGVINVIDLANFYSCAFIATDDLGQIREGKMEILGRLDQAEVRGCNLLKNSF